MPKVNYKIVPKGTASKLGMQKTGRTATIKFNAKPAYIPSKGAKLATKKSGSRKA